MLIRKKSFILGFSFENLVTKHGTGAGKMAQLVNHFWMSLMTWFQSLGSTHGENLLPRTVFWPTHVCHGTCGKKKLSTQTHTEREKKSIIKYWNNLNIADISFIKINNYACFSSYYIKISFFEICRKLYITRPMRWGK